MCSHCVQTCPRFPSDLKQEGKSLPFPSAGRHPPWEAGWALTIRFSGTFRVSLKPEKPPARGETKAAPARHPQPGCPGGDKEQRTRTPHTAGRARPRGSGSPGKAALNPMARGSAFKFLCAGTGKRIKSHLCPEAGRHTLKESTNRESRSRTRQLERPRRFRCRREGRG